MKCRILLAGIAWLALSSAALADTPAQARKAIETIYAKEQAALARKDIDAVFAFQTPDYVGITRSGKRITREQSNQQGRQLTMAKKIVSKIRIMDFVFKDNTAIVRTKNHINVTIANPQTNQDVPVTVDSTVEDTWVKRGGRWLTKQQRIITLTQKMGGAK